MGFTRKVLIYLIILFLFYEFVIPWFARSRYYDYLFFSFGKRGLNTLLSRKIDPKFDAQRINYYEDLSAWASHPLKYDWADVIPPNSFDGEKGTLLENNQNNKERIKADLFFIYPTSYMGFEWNGKINQTIFQDFSSFVHDLVADATPMVHATPYNGIANVYAPRYRQMTGWVFFSKTDEEVNKTLMALEVAYRDVEDAFDAFLKFTNENNNQRPIIIAGHSQGSLLGSMLLRRRFRKNSNEYKRLAAAYLIGANIHLGDTGDVPACAFPTSTNCFVAYNSFEKDGNPEMYVMHGFLNKSGPMVCVNPLTFTLTQPTAGETLNLGSRPFLRPFQVIKAIVYGVLGISYDFNLQSGLEEKLFDAHCDEKTGVLFVNHLARSIRGYVATGIFPGLNLHGSETSFYWMNTRKNAELRVEILLKKKNVIN